MKSGKEQRFEMTAEDIDLLVKNFYSEVRKDPILGPVFHNAIGFEAKRWSLHEKKIASFWRKAISMDADYCGNPMKTHIANPDIQPEHFEIWLALFQTVVKDILSPAKARNISLMANRIGRGLMAGVKQARQGPEASSVPSRSFSLAKGSNQSHLKNLEKRMD